MANEEPKFCSFTFKRKDDNRAKKIEELKKKFNLQRVLQLIERGELTEDDDESSVAAKISQLEAVEDLEAFQENMDKEKEKLAKDLQDLADKEINKNKLLQEIQELAQKENGFEQHYQEYLERQKQLQDEINELNQQNKDTQQKSEELANLEAANREHINKHQKLDAISKALVDCERAEFFANLPKETQENLAAFAKDCKDQQRLDSDENNMGFKEVLDSLRFDSREHSEEYRSFAPRKDENGKLENNHIFKLDNNGLIRHEIHNLGGAELDICIVNGRFNVLKNQDLSEEQLKILAEYCCKNSFEIENSATLKNLKVKNSDGAETGTADIRLQEEMQRLYNAERGQMSTPQQSTEATPVQEPEPQADDKEDFCQFIPNKDPNKMDRRKVTDNAHTRIEMLPGLTDPTLRRVTRYGNSTIISVYASEEDMRIDGERDKNGKRIHSKQFSVELDFSTPPKPRFYIGNIKEFKCDHARIMLDPYKKIGYKYFIIPPVTQIGGKMSGGAFMEASVKTQMIPLLKRSTGGKGCDVGTPDLETIFKKMPEEGDLKGEAKVEYMMRWYRELKAYNNRIDDKTGKPVSPNKQLGVFQEQFRVGANFVTFQASHQESLEDYIADKFNKSQKSDNEKRVDKITATIAMTKILQDLQKGKLNGKIFNPLNEPSNELCKGPYNDQLLKETLDIYMAKENANVTKRFNDLVESYSNKKSGITIVSDKAEDNAMNALLREYTDPKEGEMSKTLARIKGYGVELQHPYIAKPKILGERSSSSSRDDDDDRKRRQVAFAMATSHTH